MDSFERGVLLRFRKKAERRAPLAGSGGLCDAASSPFAKQLTKSRELSSSSRNDDTASAPSPSISTISRIALLCTPSVVATRSSSH